MAIQTLIVKQSLAKGAHEPGDINVGVGVTQIDITLDKTDLLDKSVAAIVCFFYSGDGGASWRPLGACGCTGGERTEMIVPITVPNPNLKTGMRKIRPVLVLTANANTGMSCEER